MKVSIWRASLAGMYWVTSKSLTSPAMCVVSGVGSKREMRLMPERPLTILSQALAMSLPTGLTIPRPVMTTRRFTEDSSNRQNKGGFREALRARTARPREGRYFLPARGPHGIPETAPIPGAAPKCSIRARGRIQALAYCLPCELM
ncbi:Uncharacterised protein [Bordetella pertussis]|nr:Uncharacterised protein [Bordetella pertussis]CFU79620.1 Uncharacterised protein [Bordetella pertussis]CPH69326.1 Uncharacterised protein [Bordetella pertussis]CPN17162.1 Uncharacterised protein [Bordetella pertussis]